MFRFTVIAVGKLKSAPLAELCRDFSGRLERMGRLDVVELPDGPAERANARVEKALESRRAAHIYALAEEGRARSSEAFARELWASRGGRAVFVVGGAYGLGEAVKARANELLSLSPMTFTHEMARLLLLEQLYRAASIHSGGKYHH